MRFSDTSIDNQGNLDRVYDLSKFNAEYYSSLHEWSGDDRYLDEVKYFLLHIPLNHNHPNIVDIGCGNFRSFDMIKELFPSSDVIGIDIPVSKHNNHDYILTGWAEQIPLESSSIDLVLFIHSIGHVKSPEDAINESYRILKDDGILAILTPSLQHQMEYISLNKGEFVVEDTVLRYYSDQSLIELTAPYFRDIGSMYFGQRQGESGTPELLSMIFKKYYKSD